MAAASRTAPCGSRSCSFAVAWRSLRIAPDGRAGAGTGAARRGARVPTGSAGTVARVRNRTHELVGVSLAVAAGRVLEAGPLETRGWRRLPCSVRGFRMSISSARACTAHAARAAHVYRRDGGRAAAASRHAVRGRRAASDCDPFGVGLRRAAGLVAVVATPAGAPSRSWWRAGWRSATLARRGGRVHASWREPVGTGPRRRVWLLPRRARIRTGSWREVAFAVAAATTLAVALLA